MASEPGKQPKPPLAPDPVTRVACWLGIYLFGILVYLCIANQPGYSGSTLSPQALLLVPLFFPWGLAMPVYSLVLRTGIDLTLFLFLVVVYGIYGIHFALTLKAHRRRAFLLLIYSLILLVSTNIAGCKEVEKESRDSQVKLDQKIGEADQKRQEEQQKERSVPKWGQPQNRPY